MLHLPPPARLISALVSSTQQGAMALSRRQRSCTSTRTGMQSLVEQPHGDACERRQNVDGRDTTNGCRWFHISQSTCVTALARERLTKEQERNTHDPRSRRRGCRERWAGKDASKRPYYMIHTPYPIFTPKRYSAAIPHITKAAVQHDRKREYKNSPQRKIDLPTSPESSKAKIK
jgi:hypothetical protein